MNITIVVATYWPKLDGVQMVTQYQAEGLVKKGHNVTVLTSKEENLPETEVHNGVCIKRINAHNKLYWHIGNKREFEEIVINQGKTSDAIIAVCLQSFAADWMLSIMDKIECRKILYLHGMPDFKLHKADCISIYNTAKTCFRNIRWKFFYKRHWKQITKFNAVIHLFKNDNSYTYFEKHGYKENHIIENSCENTFFEKSPTPHPYFLYVGNYCQRKNQIFALESFYKTNLNDYGMIFIGSKENAYCKFLKEKNEILQKKFGKKNVQILHGKTREEIISLTKSAYATIMTSTFEYYPIVIVESMASAVPFISTNVGIIRMLPGGIICSSKIDLIYWLEFFAKNPDIRNSIGQTGKLYASTHLTMEQKVRQLEDILKSH